MEIQKYLLLFAIALFPATTFAEQKPCEALSSKWGSGATCQCGNVLSNLKVTAPKGFRLKDVCQFRHYPFEADLKNIGPKDRKASLGDSGPSGSYPLDLKHNKASLDESSPSGEYPIGTIYLSGELFLTGTVVVDPSDSGTMFFYPTPKQFTFPRETVFAKRFRSFKLGSKEDLKNFNVTKEMLSRCWEAETKIRLRDIAVELSDSDSAGTYPRKVKVLRVTPWKKCSEKYL
jgi:hypothetical protein